MANTQAEHPRASNGRFIKKKAAKRAAATAARSGQSGPTEQRSESAPHDGSVQLVILTAAIVLAVLGFAVHFLWIAAVVVMGILWGTMLTERQQRRGTVKGLAAEMVSTVVDEAKGVVEATNPESGAVTHGPSARDEKD